VQITTVDSIYQQLFEKQLPTSCIYGFTDTDISAWKNWWFYFILVFSGLTFSKTYCERLPNLCDERRIVSLCTPCGPCVANKCIINIMYYVLILWYEHAASLNQFTCTGHSDTLSTALFLRPSQFFTQILFSPWSLVCLQNNKNITGRLSWNLRNE